MKNFSRYGCDFIINDTLKESNEKNVYSSTMKRRLSYIEFQVEEEVIIIKILKSCEREIIYLSSLKHQCIPNVIMIWEEGDYITIVQEKIIGFSLFDYMKEHINIPRNKSLMIAYDLANVLLYLHKKSGYNIVHGDISPNNIVISNMNEVYLIDFGCSFSDRIVKKETNYYGTKGYFSPKIIEKPMSVDRSIDIYSFGMILKLLEIDKISVEGYELYKKCIEENSNYKFGAEHIIEELLYLFN